MRLRWSRGQGKGGDIAGDNVESSLWFLRYVDAQLEGYLEELLVDILFRQSVLEAQDHHPVGVVGFFGTCQGRFCKIAEMLHAGDRRRSIDSHCRRA